MLDIPEDASERMAQAILKRFGWTASRGVVTSSAGVPLLQTSFDWSPCEHWHQAMFVAQQSELFAGARCVLFENNCVWVVAQNLADSAADWKVLASHESGPVAVMLAVCQLLGIAAEATP